MDKQCAYFGNPWIGMFIKSNNEKTFIPIDTHEKLISKISANLKTEVIKLSICDSNLLGIYLAMNSNGIIVPNIASDAEVELIKKSGLNVYISKDKNNAFGNNILVNDKGALVNENIDQKELKNIEDALGVEAITGKIANHTTVGSACIANNAGFLAHFATTDSEFDVIKKHLKVDGAKGSINMGVGFISFGVVQNKNSYLSGEKSSAFELGRVEEALGYLDTNRG